MSDKKPTITIKETDDLFVLLVDHTFLHQTDNIYLNQMSPEKIAAELRAVTETMKLWLVRWMPYDVLKRAVCAHPQHEIAERYRNEMEVMFGTRCDGRVEN